MELPFTSKRRDRTLGWECVLKGRENGEPGRNRTCDPRIKSALLYQLSYGPTASNLTHVKRATETAWARPPTPILPHETRLWTRFSSRLLQNIQRQLLD